MSEHSFRRLEDWLDGGVLGDADSPTKNETPAGADSTQRDESQSRKIAATLVVHGLLQEHSKLDLDPDEARVAAVMQQILTAGHSDSVERKNPKPTSVSAHRAEHSRSVNRLVWSAIAAILSCVVVGGFLSLYTPEPASAASVLELLIQTSLKQKDRTYEISVVEDYDPQRMPLKLRDVPIKSRKTRLDGATLHLRGVDEFVLIQKRADGQTRIVGCDGRESWAFKEMGPIHVSSDLSRFRGTIPGSQQELPFINIREHLEQLRTGYDIQIQSQSDDGKNSVLTGVRKSKDVRGPKKMAIEYVVETGLMQRLFLDGLPRRGGGPRSVIVELVDQEQLAPDFFTREFHHGPERKIKYVEDRP